MKHALSVAVLATSLLAAPFLSAHAQTAPAQTAPAEPAPAATPPASPNLVTATVKLDSGWRASKLIGSSVYDDSNHQIGTVDDLIVAGENKLSNAIISVGGFLGIGSKLVAVPFDQLHYNPADQNAKVVLPGVTKDSLNQMPGFTYGNS